MFMTTKASCFSPKYPLAQIYTNPIVFELRIDINSVTQWSVKIPWRIDQRATLTMKG